MRRDRSYLDHNATAPLRPEARAAMIEALALTGNASSIHAEGRRAREIVEAARAEVAALVGARASEVVFTSGASEANNWVVAAGWDTIFAAGIEHDSVLAPARAVRGVLHEIPAGAEGVAHAEAVADRVLRGAPPAGRTLVALQMANNETGVIQPVAETASFARAHGLWTHTDAVQAAGRIAIDFAGLGVETLALSSHKLGGPMGVGALVVADRVVLAPFVRGGGQERRRRAGTENVAAIAGFGAAAAAARRGLADDGRIRALRDRLEAGARAIAPGAVVVGAGADRLANTTCLALPGMLAETLVIKLDLAGIAASAGAACSSGKVGESTVLAAMGLAPEITRGAIRLSLGPATTPAEIDHFLDAWRAFTGRHTAAGARPRAARTHTEMTAGER
jgi:cysteine desulfurase